MAKKEFKTGIDALLQPSVKTGEAETVIDNHEDFVGIHLRIPTLLKRKIDIRCAELGIKKQDYLKNAIENSLNGN